MKLKKLEPKLLYSEWRNPRKSFNRMRNTAGHNNLYNKHVHEFIIHISGEGMQDNISKEE